MATRIEKTAANLRGHSDAWAQRLTAFDRAAKSAPPRREAPVAARPAPAESGPVTRMAAVGNVAEVANDIGRAERKILSVLAKYPEGCQIGKIALLAIYRVTGTFRNALGYLRSNGLIEGPNTGVMRITEAGLGALGPDAEPLPPPGGELAQYWLGHPSLGGCERKILVALLENPEGMDIAGLSAATGYQVTGSFRNALGSLRTAGVVVGRNTGVMRAHEDLLGW